MGECYRCRAVWMRGLLGCRVVWMRGLVGCRAAWVRGLVGCRTAVATRPVSEEEEIVVGVVGDFFFALSLVGTFGPPQEER